MPRLITICLTQEQQEKLEQIRDTDKRPYMRERAAAILNGDFAHNARCWLWKGLKPFSAFCTFCKAPWIQGSLSSYCPKSTDHGSNRFLSDTTCWILTCCRKASRAFLTSLWYGNDLLSRIFIIPSMISIEAPWWIIRFLTVDMERSFQREGRTFFWIRHSNFQQ